MVEIIVTENGNVRGVFTRVISASLTDSLNGECTFQFSVISSMAKEIFTGLEVELKSDTLNYLFNVVKVSKSLSNGITICTVECEHKSYELNNDEYKLTEFDFEGAPSECLISLLQGTSLTAGICDPAIEKIPAAIVAAQSLAVDTVTGATVTSKAILAAAEQALTEAGADIEALKTAALCAAMLEELGFKTEPGAMEKRSDIIQTITLETPENLKRFCRGIQAGSPVDSYVTPEPWAMPGYGDEVIMAAGAFVQGSSIELSADGPMREPYRAFLQGGLTYESGRLGIMNAIAEMLDK